MFSDSKSVRDMLQRELQATVLAYNLSIDGGVAQLRRMRLQVKIIPNYSGYHLARHVEAQTGKWRVSNFSGHLPRDFGQMEPILDGEIELYPGPLTAELMMLFALESA